MQVCRRFAASLLVALLALPSSAPALANGPAADSSPWLAVDRHRHDIIADIVARWKSLPANGSAAMLDEGELRAALAGLRADQLFRASLARDAASLAVVLAESKDTGLPVSRARVQEKLGTSRPDLAYTPIVPCRIVDTRFALGGALTAGGVRNWRATQPGGSFATQGGSGSDCGIPVKAAAVTMNLTVFNTSAGPAFLTAWPFGQPQPLAATLNWTAAASQVGIGALVSLCTTGACTSDFSLYSTAGTELVIDVLGYFSAPDGGYVFHVAKSGAQFTSIQAAIDAAALLATSTQSYVVKVAPGQYTEQIVLKDYVDVEGSGPSSTVIFWTAGRPTVTVGAQAEMRQIGIVNDAPGTIAGGAGAIGVYQPAQSANGFSRLFDVNILAAGPGENQGVLVANGPLHITASDVAGGATTPVLAGAQYGVVTDGNALVTVRDSRVFGNSLDNARSARRLNASTLRISNTRMSGPTEGTPNCFSVYTSNLQPFTCN